MKTKPRSYRVVMADGTIHLLRSATALTAAERWPDAARIERMDVKAPAIIEDENDG